MTRWQKMEAVCALSDCEATTPLGQAIIRIEGLRAAANVEVISWQEFRKAVTRCLNDPTVLRWRAL